MTVRTATEFVEMCENVLGWTPDSSKPLWKARQIMAGRVNKTRASNPTLYSWLNLELTVEWLRRKRQMIQSPLFVFYKVEEAVREANRPEPPRPLTDLIAAALADEMMNPTPSDFWVGRLTRSAGLARQDVYDEWVAERGVQ